MKPIFLLGEAWGENEAKIGKPFVGPSGIELMRLLNESGIISLSPADRGDISKYFDTGDPRLLDRVWEMHREVYRWNVFQLHPAGNDLRELCGPQSKGIVGYPSIGAAKFVRKEFQDELDNLGDRLLDVDPNVVVALGNVALWALLGSTGIKKYRGTALLSSHCVAGYKLVATYHPAAILRDYAMRPTVLFDLIKAKRESEYPEIRRPPCEIWIEPEINDIQTFFEQNCKAGSTISVDIETSGKEITCIGFAPRRDLAIVIPFDDPRRPGGSYWASAELERQCWELIRKVLEDSTIYKTFQNGLYDIAFLFRAVGIRVFGAREDTMLLHHALQPESPKALGYLGSLYTDHGPWKTERKGTATIKRDE
jgi:uracil-DNA glycosylase